MMQQQMQSPPGYGIPYNPSQPKCTNWLTPEQLEEMKKNLPQFNLSVTENDLRKAQCNHYNHNGTTALLRITENGQQKFQCTNCGTIFSGHEYTQEQVQEAVDTILDILNNTKVMYHTLAPDAALNFFQIIAFIEKVPHLYTLAANDNQNFERAIGFVPQYPRMQTPIMFNMMNGGFGIPQYAGYPMQQPMAPGVQNMWMAPGQTQPMQQPVYGAPGNPGVNPLFGPPPATYGFSPNAQWQQPPQQPPQQQPQQQPTQDSPSVPQAFKK